MNQLKRLVNYLKWVKTEHRDKKSVQETYDELASTHKYDAIVGFDQRSNSLEQLVKDQNFKGKKILDLACGTGAFIAAVINKNPEEVVGVDLSSKMQEVAKERFSQYSNLTLVNKSFMDVTFQNESFDFILLANAARYIPLGKEDLFFTNVKKWLKPTGVFIMLSDDFLGKSLIGKCLLPLTMHLLDKEKTNINTANYANLENILKKHFNIIESKDVVWGLGPRVTHRAYFCMRND